MQCDAARADTLSGVLDLFHCLAMLLLVSRALTQSVVRICCIIARQAAEWVLQHTGLSLFYRFWMVANEP